VVGKNNLGEAEFGKHASGEENLTTKKQSFFSSLPESSKLVSAGSGRVAECRVWKTGNFRQSPER
jgi:hypothetical protein